MEDLTLKPIKKFKDEFIVVFNGDKFIFRSEKHKIFGVSGIDIDLNRVQLRDDLVIVNLKRHKAIKFSDLIRYWSEIEALLIPIVKKKELIKRKV